MDYNYVIENHILGQTGKQVQ